MSRSHVEALKEESVDPSRVALIALRLVEACFHAHVYDKGKSFVVSFSDENYPITSAEAQAAIDLFTQIREKIGNEVGKGDYGHFNGFNKKYRDLLLEAPPFLIAKDLKIEEQNIVDKFSGSVRIRVSGVHGLQKSKEVRTNFFHDLRQEIISSGLTAIKHIEVGAT